MKLPINEKKVILKVAQIVNMVSGIRSIAFLQAWITANLLYLAPKLDKTRTEQ